MIQLMDGGVFLIIVKLSVVTLRLANCGCDVACNVVATNNNFFVIYTGISLSGPRSGLQICPALFHLFLGGSKFRVPITDELRARGDGLNPTSYPIRLMWSAWVHNSPVSLYCFIDSCDDILCDANVDGHPWMFWLARKLTPLLVPSETDSMSVYITSSKKS
jgi:hypothetical protein